MADKNQTLTEDLFQAIQTIADKSLEGLKYDKTILCSVTDDTNRDEGQYTVSDGSIEFTAYSDNTKYREGNNVYVTIPEGDYDNRRIIIGKYQKDEESPYIYISPMENYVHIINNFVDSNITTGLVANGIAKLELIQSLSGLSFNGYDRLGIKANFMSLLNEFNTVSGNYGLALKINCYEKRTTEYQKVLYDKDNRVLYTDENNNNEEDVGEELITLESGERTQTYWLYFDSDDMFGNPYNFVAYTEQEKVFDISSFTQIDSIDIYFYQGNNFKDNTNNLIPSSGTSIIDNVTIIDDFTSNLFVNNIEITLGYDLSQFENNTILLYTLDSKTYSAIAGQNNGNIKTLEMRWIREVNNNMVAFDENADLLQDESVEIHWYRWRLANNVFDNLAGAFWEEDRELSIQSNKFQKIFNPAVNLQQERLKVIIIRHMPGISEDDSYDEIFESNILELENEDQVPNPATIDLIRGLQLTTDDGCDGIYCLYGQNTELMNDKDAKIERHLIASYESLVTNISGLDGTELVTWKIPATNTMIGDIKAPGENSQWNVGWVIEDGYRVLKDQPIPELTEVKTVTGETNERKAFISYKIEKVYSQTATNNTVICIIKKNNLNYQAELPMSFATAGTSGTDYTLVLEVSDGDKHSLGLTKNSTLIVRAQLRNYDNTPVENASITFSWWNISGAAQGVSLSTVTKNNNFNYCTLTNTNGQNNIAKPLILEATTMAPDTGIVLKAQLPISLCAQDYIYHILEGPTKIIFDNIGTNSIYTKKPYKLFIKDTTVANTEKIVPISWSAILFNKNGVNPVSNPNYNGYATIKSTNDGINNYYYLIPPQMYLNNLNDIICVVGTINKNVVYYQPILMIQNHYGSSMLNRWDGSLQIDEQNNSILTSIIGAGEKDSQNRFSGVLMGTIRDKDPGSTTSTDKTGLLGYAAGKRTFLLSSSTGKLELGASGAGQIIMDGTSGIIKSSNYDANSDGMQIDLTEGTIDAFNFKLTSNKVVINSNGNDTNPIFQIRTQKTNGKSLMFIGDKQYFLQSVNNNIKLDLASGSLTAAENFEFKGGNKIRLSTTSPYFKISDGTNTLINMADNNYYLQSQTFTEGRAGFQLSFSENRITGYNTTLKLYKKNENDTVNNYLLLDSGQTDYPFKIGSKFKVNWNGSMTASGGEIGGWIIDSNRLTTNSGHIGMAKYDSNNSPIFWSGATAWDLYTQASASDKLTSWSSAVSFGISGNGDLYVNKGVIGGWNINSTYLEGGSAGKLIVLKPSEGIKLGSYQSMQMDQSTGQLKATGQTTNCIIKPDGTFIGKSFEGNLKGNADTASWAWSAHQADGINDKNTKTQTVLTGAYRSGNYIYFYRSSVTVLATTSLSQISVSAKEGDSGGTGGCFLAGTQILMADYTVKNIEDVKIGDYVISYNERTKTFCPGYVQGTRMHHHSTELLHIIFENGITLDVTFDHPLLSTTGWKSRDISQAFRRHATITTLLNKDDQLISYYGNYKIKEISIIKSPKNNPFFTYNICIANSHTYLANNIVVHNAYVKK